MVKTGTKAIAGVICGIVVNEFLKTASAIPSTSAVMIEEEISVVFFFISLSGDFLLH